jgi:glycerol-3-phosphate dehydrogenase subunit B
VPATRDEWFRARFFDPAGQPIFHTGVPVSRNFQPVALDGTRVYTNVWVAGGLLANTDPILERSLEGIALASGGAAARQVVSG